MASRTQRGTDGACHEDCPVTSNQPPYSMFESRSRVTILPFAEKKTSALSIMPAHAFWSIDWGDEQAGALPNFPSDDFRRNAKNYQELSYRGTWPCGLHRENRSPHGVSAGVCSHCMDFTSFSNHRSDRRRAKAKQVEGVILRRTFQLSREEFPKSRTICPKTCPNRPHFSDRWENRLSGRYAFRRT